jgi:hypothetical protein
MDVESDSQTVASHQATSRNYVKFYPKWKRFNKRSEEEGREIGEYRDYVMIVCPGQPKSEVHREVQEKDKREYSSEWKAYKENKEQRINGTPVEILPGLEKSRADSLKTVYIYTIEQLADASEPAKHAIGMGANDLVNRAKAYLQKNNAAVVGLQQENEVLKKTLEMMQAQIAELQANAEKKKPGRPKKIVQPSPVGPQ